MWQSTFEVPFSENFKYYFSLDCIKRFARDLLEKEIENFSKFNKNLMFTTEDDYTITLINYLT